MFLFQETLLNSLLSYRFHFPVWGSGRAHTGTPSFYFLLPLALSPLPACSMSSIPNTPLTAPASAAGSPRHQEDKALSRHSSHFPAVESCTSALVISSAVKQQCVPLPFGFKICIGGGELTRDGMLLSKNTLNVVLLFFFASNSF